MADPDDPKSPPEDELTDDDLDALDPADEIGGDAAPHPEFKFPSILVGPADTDQFNTIEEWIRPVACWRLDDTRFEFDSSFVKPGAARELRMLAETRDDHPGATLSLFGHADPVGNDEYNKALSGRRAQAIYAMLIRKPETWEKLFHPDPKCAGDNWGQSSIETMLAAVGRDTAEAPKLMPKSAAPDRQDLYLQYMNLLCGPKLKLTPGDFLARGSDADLRGDVQGCGEFNPVRRFSKTEDSDFQKAANKPARDSENAPNRRVVGFLFAPTLQIDGTRWPCPAASDGTQKCLKRLFVNHKDRRATGEQRRKFATDKNTFECRFYHRLAVQSPCETSSLTVLQRLRVRLRLVYLDPDKVERPFPKGFRVTAVMPDGSVRRSRVGDDGKVRFVVDRPPGSFFLQFDSKGPQFFVVNGTDSAADTPKPLIGDDGVQDTFKQGFRFFQVPLEWSTKNSDWVTAQSPLFKDGVFSGIDDLTAVLGTIEAPVKMVLDPHWQFLRWVYFDRAALKQVQCPPMIVDGFEFSKKPLTTPDTRSNWTTDGNKTQCLPWIRRDRNRPDDDVLIQLNPGLRLFAKTGEAKALVVDETGAPGTIAKSVVETPSIERLKFYDLPAMWKSRRYRAKLGAKSDTFEKLAAQGTSDGQPITFSLDDIVLTDEKFKAITWVPSKDRVAIFSNKIHNGTAAGLFRPDSGVKGVSQIPSIITDRNYLADYPDWVRLIVMRGSLYDVFDHRSADDATEVVGARAAVRWQDGTVTGGPGNPTVNAGDAPAKVFRTMTAVRVGFLQDHFIGERNIGRMDQAILRCCEVVSGVERAVNLHYLRLNFRFKPDTISSGDQQAYVDKGMEGVMKRWNGPDGDKNKGGVILAPSDSEPLQVPVIWFAQSFPQPLSVPFVNKEAQYRIDVLNDARAFMKASDGTGQIKKDENVPDGDAYTLAHECGHGDSMADEYLESSMDCSYRQPGYREYIPGGPYFGDESAMMRGNIQVRNRHFWHSAEWLKTLFGKPFVVKYDAFTYSLPPHKDAPSQTFVTTPFAFKQNCRSGTGIFDCWLYRLGSDLYSEKVLNKGPFDGFISINVRMKLTFLNKKGSQETDHDDLKDYASKIFESVRDRLNGKFIASGTVDGVSFKRARISFFPRLLVVNDSGDADYHKSLDNPGDKAYAQLVSDIDSGRGPTHFNVSVTKSGNSSFSAVSSPGAVVFNQKDFDLVDDFPAFFAAMVGVSIADLRHPGNALTTPANFLPAVKQVIPDATVSAL